MPEDHIHKLIDSKFNGCYVAGCPIGAPFTSTYKTPIGKGGYSFNGVETFIILPFERFCKGVINLVPRGVGNDFIGRQFPYTGHYAHQSADTASSKSLADVYNRVVESDSEAEVTIEEEVSVFDTAGKDDSSTDTCGSDNRVVESDSEAEVTIEEEVSVFDTAGKDDSSTDTCGSDNRVVESDSEAEVTIEEEVSVFDTAGKDDSSTDTCGSGTAVGDQVPYGAGHAMGGGSPVTGGVDQGSLSSVAPERITIKCEYIEPPESSYGSSQSIVNDKVPDRWKESDSYYDKYSYKEQILGVLVAETEGEGNKRYTEAFNVRKSDGQHSNDGESQGYNKSKRKRKTSSKNTNALEEQYMKPKIKLLSEEDDVATDKNRRKSSRMQSKGFRPDYLAIEHLDGTSDIENSLSEREENVGTEIKADPDQESYRIYKMEDVSDSDGTAAAGEQQITDRAIRNVNEDDASENSELQKSDDDGDDKSSSSDDPDFNLEESEDYESDNGSSDGTYVQKKRKKSNDPDFTIEGAKTKKVKSKKELKERVPKVPKLKIKKEPKKRIKINIHDHTDKYTTKVVLSTERRHRNKPVEEISKEVYECLLCNALQTASIDVLEKHVEEHVNGEMNCTHCEFTATNAWHVRNHIRQEHGKQSRAYTVCHICGVNYMKAKLKHHMGRCHNEPVFTCNFCTQSFVSKFKRNSHENTEHEAEVKWCDKCNRRMSAMDAEAFTNHVADCVGIAYTCEQCGKVFGAMHLLTQHKARHADKRTHPCPKCPALFRGNKNLQRHLKTHDGIHPYQCDQCTFSCVQHNQLKSHMRTHTGHKPFKCDECNYAASWNVQLKDHKKVHGLPMTVMCPVCNVLFKDGRSIAMHQKKEHQQLQG